MLKIMVIFLLITLNCLGTNYLNISGDLEIEGDLICISASSSGEGFRYVGNMMPPGITYEHFYIDTAYPVNEKIEPYTSSWSIPTGFKVKGKHRLTHEVGPVCGFVNRTNVDEVAITDFTLRGGSIPISTDSTVSDKYMVGLWSNIKYGDIYQGRKKPEYFNGSYAKQTVCGWVKLVDIDDSKRLSIMDNLGSYVSVPYQDYLNGPYCFKNSIGAFMRYHNGASAYTVAITTEVTTKFVFVAVGMNTDRRLFYNGEMVGAGGALDAYVIREPGVDKIYFFWGLEPYQSSGNYLRGSSPLGCSRVRQTSSASGLLYAPMVIFGTPTDAEMKQIYQYQKGLVHRGVNTLKIVDNIFAPKTVFVVKGNVTGSKSIGDAKPPKYSRQFITQNVVYVTGDLTVKGTIYEKEILR